MARAVTRIRYVRKAPKKKWAPYLNSYTITDQQDQNNVVSVNRNTTVGFLQLIDNSGQLATPTPTVTKVGNFKVHADAYYKVIPDVTVCTQVYIVFVPELWLDPGFTTAQKAIKMSQIPTSHPEWILAMGALQSETSSGGTGTFLLNTTSKQFSSRMKRNLQSGDSIFILAITQVQETVGQLQAQLLTGVGYHFDIRCFTCKN